MYMPTKKYIFVKRLLNYVKGVKLWSKVTVFWNIDRTVKSTCLALSKLLEKIAATQMFKYLNRLELLNLDDTYKLGVVSFMHKYFYKNLPTSFHDMFNSLAEPEQNHINLRGFFLKR